MSPTYQTNYLLHSPMSNITHQQATSQARDKLCSLCIKHSAPSCYEIAKNKQSTETAGKVTPHNFHMYKQLSHGTTAQPRNKTALLRVSTQKPFTDNHMSRMHYVRGAQSIRVFATVTGSGRILATTMKADSTFLRDFEE